MVKIYLSAATLSAIGAAILFGASTPFAKQLIFGISPILLAGLLYLGSGVGLTCCRFIKNRGWKPPELSFPEWFWLLGAIFFGGILGPIFFMLGLVHAAASMASLLLNLEAVLTAVLAWCFFKEHTDRRMVMGMLFIVIGGIILAWPGHLSSSSSYKWLSSITISLACLCWAIDNNLTRKISAADPLFIASSKGLVAGIINISLALAMNTHLPSFSKIGVSLVIGFLGYGMSLVLFVVALRGLGTARTGAYFSTAPFIGATIAILFFNEPTSIPFWIATILMGIGVLIHLTEQHEHIHTHEELHHNHSHYHDEHHQHDHDFDWDKKEPHSHPHTHKHMTHAHQHYPDIHHRHKH